MNCTAKLYIGNSQQMDMIENCSVDFIFTGPPYWNHLEYSKEKMQLGNIHDYDLFQEEISKVWAECYRVIKPGAVLCVQANDLYIHDGESIIRRIPLMEDFSRHIVRKGFLSVNIIFWDSYLPVKSERMPKEERQGARSYHMIPQRMQYLLFFVKPGKATEPLKKHDAILTRYYWQPFWRIKTERKWMGSTRLYKLIRFFISRIPIGDIINIPVLKRIKNMTVQDFRKDKTYPAVSDYTVVQKVLNDFTEPSDIILDPFAGSGTTLMAAQAMNRKCIGYEINEDAADIIRERMEGDIDII